ncbi:tyrosine-type recombinase/integrase [Myroides sp. LJL119]
MEQNIEKFLDYLLKEKKYSVLTIQAYKVDIISFFKFVKQLDVEIVTVNYDLIRLWIVELSSREYSNRSINRKLSSLKSFFKFQQHIGQIHINPMQLHRSLKVGKRLQIPFSRKEIESVRNQLLSRNDFAGLRDLLVVDLFYLLGIRRSELIGLKLSDIDLIGKRIRILGKGSKVRYVPMIDELISLCEEYLVARSLVVDKAEIHFVVLDDGNKVNEMFVYRLINSYFSNVTTKEKKSPHMLRHSFASHLIEEGADINSVKELMGHESLSTTSIYTQVNLQELKRVYEKAHPRKLKK